MLRAAMSSRSDRTPKRKVSPAAPRVRRTAPATAAGNGTIRLRFGIPSTREGIRDAVARVMKAARELRCGRSERADVEIALREALANAVFHGNRGDPAKKVFLRCSLSPVRGMVLCIRDQGGGFDPDRIPDPRERDRIFLHHGRGLLLMRALMDRVEHRDGGREVVLTKEPCEKKPERAVARPVRARRR